ncbi:ABC transporter substrate-binding protein [Pleionea sediminis]|uniref:ABC transporter substrate-binding protein n=1 Tax=Pleionea sediminis TaxID=2569479 RepID=UPI001186BDFC|nr:ABC transporter substrate-binding protein [Pleionea sediminis]
MKKLLLALILSCGSLCVFADKDVEKVFEQQLESIFNELKSSPRKYQSATELKRLAEDKIISRWDIEATLLLMIGRSQWAALTDSQKTQLSRSFSDTLTRYFMEAYGFYDGQTVALSSVKLNNDRTKGWVSINIELDYMPDLVVDLSIVNRSERWLLRDVRFQGIHYTHMKRDYYQGMIQKFGVEKLVADLNKKNRDYFSALGMNSDS